MEVLKTAASGLGFQHLPRVLANVYAWKTMFEPYIESNENTHKTEIHYKNTPIQIYWKFHHQFWKFSDKILIFFFIFLLKT